MRTKINPKSIRLSILLIILFTVFTLVKASLIPSLPIFDFISLSALFTLCLGLVVAYTCQQKSDSNGVKKTVLAIAFYIIASTAWNFLYPLLVNILYGFVEKNIKLQSTVDIEKSVYIANLAKVEGAIHIINCVVGVIYLVCIFFIFKGGMWIAGLENKSSFALTKKETIILCAFAALDVLLVCVIWLFKTPPEALSAFFGNTSLPNFYEMKTFGKIVNTAYAIEIMVLIQIYALNRFCKTEKAINKTAIVTES